MPLADVSESDVELKMPASDEAFARTSRRSSIESPSVEDRLAIKLPTWSVLDTVLRPIVVMVSVKVLLTWLWTALEPFSVTICAMALAF